MIVYQSLYVIVRTPFEVSTSITAVLQPYETNFTFSIVLGYLFNVHVRRGCSISCSQICSLRVEVVKSARGSVLYVFVLFWWFVYSPAGGLAGKNLM